MSCPAWSYGSGRGIAVWKISVLCRFVVLIQPPFDADRLSSSAHVDLRGRDDDFGVDIEVDEDEVVVVVVEVEPLQPLTGVLPASSSSRRSRSPTASHDRFRLDVERGSSTPHSESCLSRTSKLPLSLT